VLAAELDVYNKQSGFNGPVCKHGGTLTAPITFEVRQRVGFNGEHALRGLAGPSPTIPRLWRPSHLLTPGWLAAAGLTEWGIEVDIGTGEPITSLSWNQNTMGCPKKSPTQIAR
jgi:hypothetical protein